MFSLKTGNEKIARIIRKGKPDKYIYLNKDDGKIILSKEFLDKYKKIPKKDFTILKKALKTRTEPKEEKVKKIYNDAIQDMNKNLLKEIKITDGIIQPIPRKSVVEKLYVSAPSGAGKSYFCGKWINEYKKIWKEDPVYLISSVQEDEALDKYDPIRISKDEVAELDFLDSDFEQSLIVFDDCHSIGDKSIRQKIQYMIDALLETGRHYETRMLITSHLFSTPYTRRIILESTSIIIYPGTGGGVYAIKQALEKYCGMDKPQINKILNLKSRWVLIQRWVPQYVIYEKGCYML
jgi:hypothetical protein